MTEEPKTLKVLRIAQHVLLALATFGMLAVCGMIAYLIWSLP